VIGILKAFLGLSASAFVTLYVSFLDRDAAAFVLLLAILPALLCLLCAPVINYVRPRARPARAGTFSSSSLPFKSITRLCMP